MSRQPPTSEGELRRRRQVAAAVEFAEYAVKRARAGELDVIHTMTEGLDREGLRAVIAVLAEAYAGATPETADVWAALEAQQEADLRRTA